jgi:hypothetical protein
MIRTATFGEIVAGFEAQRGEIQAIDKGVDGAHGLAEETQSSTAVGSSIGW